MLYRLLLVGGTVVGIGIVIVLSEIVAIARAADGYVAPQVALPFAISVDTPSDLTPPNDIMFATNMSAEQMRDVAFDWFNIVPSARRTFAEVPVYRAYGTDWAGIYNIGARRVSISQPVLHVFLHEYAHANLHRKPLVEKLHFAVALLRLRWEADSLYAPYQRILEFVMSQARKNPQGYNPVHEFYAYAAQYSGGDLDRIPGYLQPFYADYLSAGPNRWLEAQEETKSQRFVEMPGFRVLRLGRP